jgi:hypothetical protein
MVQSESVFEFAVVVFDPPADLGQPDQLVQGSVGGQVRQPVVGGFGFVGWPLGDKPAVREASVGTAGKFRLFRFWSAPERVMAWEIAVVSVP